MVSLVQAQENFTLNGYASEMLGMVKNLSVSLCMCMKSKVVWSPIFMIFIHLHWSEVHTTSLLALLV